MRPSCFLELRRDNLKCPQLFHAWWMSTVFYEDVLKSCFYYSFLKFKSKFLFSDSLYSEKKEQK